jgi:2-oxoacid:acceptor oxidoreductase delta subunit (pyruvate/2-ketoisovalerate family)
MPELTTWRELPLGGVVAPGATAQPMTGEWRTSGKPLLHREACVNCLLCWLYCPDTAFLLDGKVVAGIDYDHCKGCELCVEVCPVGAIEMVAEEVAT